MMFKVIPPAALLEGKSNELITTPFLRLSIPFKVTFLVDKEIPGTAIPRAVT